MNHSHSRDRPQLPNHFNAINIVLRRDRILVAIAPIFVKLPWKLQLLCLSATVNTDAFPENNR
ncbi:hypothetical protein QT972_03525 [Microcoleus sp. herbarium7]